MPPTTTATSTTSEVVTIGQRRLPDRLARFGWARWLRRAPAILGSVPFSVATASGMAAGSISSMATIGCGAVVDDRPRPS